MCKKIGYVCDTLENSGFQVFQVNVVYHITRPYCVHETFYGTSMLCTCKMQWYITGMLTIITLGILYLVTK